MIASLGVQDFFGRRDVISLLDGAPILSEQEPTIAPITRCDFDAPLNFISVMDRFRFHGVTRSVAAEAATDMRSPLTAKLFRLEVPNATEHVARSRPLIAARALTLLGLLPAIGLPARPVRGLRGR